MNTIASENRFAAPRCAAMAAALLTLRLQGRMVGDIELKEGVTAAVDGAPRHWLFDISVAVRLDPQLENSAASTICSTRRRRSAARRLPATIPVSRFGTWSADVSSSVDEFASNFGGGAVR